MQVPVVYFSVQIDFLWSALLSSVTIPKLLTINFGNHSLDIIDNTEIIYKKKFGNCGN